ncbi:MAG: hypothetical protein V4724_36690 [Pseudomonadota bacterium]
MMLRMQGWGLLCAMVLGATAGTTVAQSLPPVQTQLTSSGIGYVTGGVGQAQQNAMQEMKRDYTLRLTFARPKSGEYLADVKVQIDQEGNHPVNAPMLGITAGPMLFVKLPPGQYRVRAETAGQVQSRLVKISRGSAKDLIYYFPPST